MNGRNVLTGGIDGQEGNHCTGWCKGKTIIRIINHGTHTTMGLTQPWDSYNHETHPTMGLIQPWDSLNQWSHPTMGLIQKDKQNQSTYR